MRLGALISGNGTNLSWVSGGGLGFRVYMTTCRGLWEDKLGIHDPIEATTTPQTILCKAWGETC